MKKFLSVLCTAVLVLGIAGVAGAGSYTFTPTPTDLWDLDHWRYYTWGIGWEVPGGESIESVTLHFEDIGNWNHDDNVLFVHLLESATPGVTVGYDNQNDTIDAFAGQGIWLDSPDFHNLPYRDKYDITYDYDITYSFAPSEIAALRSYSADGNFGLGFDPDCHLWNDGITLNIKTVSDPVIPEPSTMLLVGLGLIGLVGLGRKRIKK